MVYLLGETKHRQTIMKDIGQGSSLIDFTDYNYIYIDKTKQIFSLLKNRRVFFSRPRRFGKSLVLDTIATLFEKGVEPYFKDTWIYDKWSDKTYPVLRLNFLDFGNSDLDTFSIRFNNCIKGFAEDLQIEKNIIGINPADTLFNLFRALKNQKIVILIDEYDCQLTANINKPKEYTKFLNCIHDLYATLKDKTQIRFMAVTGVTRLKDTTIFSVGSDIKDVSNLQYLSTLVGFTRDEIIKYYGGYLTLAAAYTNNCQTDEVTEEQKEEILEKLAEEYNGYCFDEDNENAVFSTWSVNSFFQDLTLRKKVKYGDYWYDNGGIPSILANYLKSHKLDFSVLMNDGVSININDFVNPSSLLTIDQNVLMYQTGYLTLRSKIEAPSIKLATPNMEIKRSLLKLIAFEIYGKEIFNSKDFKTFFAEENTDNIVAQLNLLLNTISYERYPIVSESMFRVCLQCLFSLVSDRVYAEMQNSKGRADLTVEIGSRRIVFELKYAKGEEKCSKKLEEAVAQIQARDYGNIMPKKELLRIAMVFNGADEIRAITHYSKV